MTKSEGGDKLVVLGIMAIVAAVCALVAAVFASCLQFRRREREPVLEEPQNESRHRGGNESHNERARPRNPNHNRYHSDKSADDFYDSDKESILLSNQNNDHDYRNEYA